MLNTIQGKSNIFVTDLRSERLFREAEDDFFYFNKFEEALEKIERALEFSPNMIKALLMRANIALMSGEIELALEFYKRAEVLAPNNIKVLAGIANIYELNNQNDLACEYIEKAMGLGIDKFNPLNKALIDLKFNILLKQKKYTEAKKMLNESKYILIQEDYMALQADNLSVLKQKLLLQKKLKQTRLKVIK